MAGIAAFPDIAARAALSTFVPQIAPLQAFGTIFDPSAVREGLNDGVEVPIVPAASGGVRTKANRGTYTFDPMDLDMKTIRPSNRQYVGFGIDDVDGPKVKSVGAVTEWGMKKGRELADSIFTAAWANVVVANYPATPLFAAATTGFDADALSDVLIDAEISQGWKPGLSSAVLSLAVKKSLRKDATIRNHNTIDSMSRKVFMEGHIPREMFGSPVWFSSVLPDNGEHIIGAVVCRGALGFVSRPITPDPVATGRMDWKLYLDKDTGITLIWKKWYNEDTSEVREILELAYGTAVLIPGNLVLITTV